MGKGGGTQTAVAALGTSGNSPVRRSEDLPAQGEGVLGSSWVTLFKRDPLAMVLHSPCLKWAPGGESSVGLHSHLSQRPVHDLEDGMKVPLMEPVCDGVGI